MNVAYFSDAMTEEMSNDNSKGWERQFHVFRSEMARYAVRSNCSGVTETNPAANAPTSVPDSETPVGASPPIQ